VVQNGEIVIVDEFTGRLMTGPPLVRRPAPGRGSQGRRADPAENQTLASITFQNYFRMYGKLAGMTGTADTEAYEFQEIYGLETVVIPTNRPSKRNDQLDRCTRPPRKSTSAVIEDIRECHERGQPVLVGTTSIENSEIIVQPAAQGKAAARGAQRQAARARGGHRHPGRSPGRDHHRHQHGRSRYRHRARRQSREDGAMRWSRTSARWATPTAPARREVCQQWQSP
jgi:hypothetical protein